MKRYFLTVAAIAAVALFQTTQAYGATQDDLHHVLYETEFDDSQCTGAVTNPTLTGSNNVQQAFNWFILEGLTPDQAAGIVGNMVEESGVNPEEVQGGGTNPDPSAAGSGGWGIVQWTPGLKIITIAKAVNVAADINSLDTLATQLQIVWNEMKGSDPSEQAQMLSLIQASTNINAIGNSGSTYVFEHYFEKAGLAALPVRIADAEQVLKQYGSQAPTGGVPQGGSTCSNSNSTVNAQGCANPWAGDSVSPERIDMGVDYNAPGGSKIGAICPGVVIGSASGGTGWISPEDTQACVYIRINGGAYVGKSYYVCEDIVPTVKKGQTVTAGQEIATFKSSSTGLETGWGSGTPYGALASQLNQECGGSDPGCWSSAAGVSFNKLIMAAGGKGGIYVPGAPPQRMPPGYP